MLQGERFFSNPDVDGFANSTNPSREDLVAALGAVYRGRALERAATREGKSGRPIKPRKGDEVHSLRSQLDRALEEAGRPVDV